MAFHDAQVGKRLRRFIASEHFRFARRPGAGAAADEVELTGAFALEIRAPASPLLRAMRRDFTRFMRTCMDVRFRARNTGGASLAFILDGKNKTQRDHRRLPH